MFIRMSHNSSFHTNTQLTKVRGKMPHFVGYNIFQQYFLMLINVNYDALKYDISFR